MMHGFVLIFMMMGIVIVSVLIYITCRTPKPISSSTQSSYQDRYRTDWAHKHNSNCSSHTQYLGPNQIKELQSQCGDELVDDYSLGHAYSMQECDPSGHILPTFGQLNFLKHCEFTKETKYVYFIIANRQHKMIYRLMNRLGNHESILLIHIDDHADIIFKHEMIDLVSGHTNRCLVQFGSVVYLTATDIEVVTAAMNWAHSSSYNWTHFIPMTGQDYPLHNGTMLNSLIANVGDKTWIPDSIGCHPANSTEAVNNNGWYHMSTFLYPCVRDGNKNPIFLNQEPWIFKNHLSTYCWGPSLSNGVFARRTVTLLVQDPVAVASYAFFSRCGDSCVEHYWPSVLRSIAPSHIHPHMPCYMSWTLGHGEADTPAPDGTHNTFLTMAQSTEIAQAHREGALFARKFFFWHRDILNFIDDLDEECQRIRSSGRATKHLGGTHGHNPGC